MFFPVGVQTFSIQLFWPRSNNCKTVNSVHTPSLRLANIQTVNINKTFSYLGLNALVHDNIKYADLFLKYKTKVIINILNTHQKINFKKYINVLAKYYFPLPIQTFYRISFASNANLSENKYGNQVECKNHKPNYRNISRNKRKILKFSSYCAILKFNYC